MDLEIFERDLLKNYDCLEKSKCKKEGCFDTKTFYQNCPYWIFETQQGQACAECY